MKKRILFLLPLLPLLLSACDGDNIPSEIIPPSSIDSSVTESFVEPSSTIEESILDSSIDAESIGLPSDYYNYVELRITVQIPEGWKTQSIYDDEAQVFAWVYGGIYGSGTWIETSNDEGVVILRAADSLEGITLARFSPEVEEPGWGNRWNQTSDIIYEDGVTEYVCELKKY